MIRFQSLKGILVNFNSTTKTATTIEDGEFQSLKGILVNFNDIDTPSRVQCFLVSIPQRDFGEFQRW
ncbi:Epoxyqueuosine (oQ) reductase QueG [Geitlerinema sp. FC II]|nr:Epoxyqueuosine (oQ) reductase QueG [Geitlerinema sp. FC II]